MAMNKKAQILFYTLMLSALILVLILALARPVKEIITSTRNDMNCSKSYITSEDYTNITGNNNQSYTGIYGTEIYAKYDLVLQEIKKDEDNTATIAYVYESDGTTLIDSSEFIGDTASFNIPLSSENYYQIGIDNNGLDYSVLINCDDWETMFPIVRENINFNNGYLTLCNFGIKSVVTTKAIDSSLSEYDQAACYGYDILFWFFILIGIALVFVVLGAKIING